MKLSPDRSDFHFLRACIAMEKLETVSFHVMIKNATVATIAIAIATMIRA